MICIIFGTQEYLNTDPKHRFFIALDEGYEAFVSRESEPKPKGF